MNCASYIALTPKEKTELIGKLVHAVQNSEICFSAAQEIVELAEKKGIFNDVIVNPSP